MNRMQEDFIQRVDELRKSHRPHANYVKDFERRAAEVPKRCAEEAVREVLASTRTLSRAFRKAFGEDFEDALKRVFYLTPEGTQALRADAELPENPVAQEFFLIWLYWLHFYKITMFFFLRCLLAPDGPHEGHARAMCACFVRHELSSRFVSFMVQDDILGRFPHPELKAAFIRNLTAYFIVHTSLGTNKKLRTRIAELREPGESNYERLIQEMSGEVWSVWREQRSVWKTSAFHPDQIMEMRSEIARRLEGRPAAPSETDLGEFADRENSLRLLKLGREGGLPPREYELLKLFAEKPNISSREAGEALGITPGAVRALKSRIRNTLRTA
jgi:DNA-binding CsgD family transcriptional regulator